MEPQTECVCLNCNQPVGHAYCAHCGQPTTPMRLNFEWFVNELLDVTSHITPHTIIRTVGAMIFQPGATILEYITGRRIVYQQPLTYLVLGYGIYFLSSEYLFAHGTWESGTLSGVNRLEVALTLLLIAIAAHLVLSRPKFNFIETAVIISYIYGTAFILAPLVILLQIPLQHPFLAIPVLFRPLVVDIPLMAISFYVAVNFCKTAGLSLFRLLIVAGIALALGIQGQVLVW